MQAVHGLAISGGIAIGPVFFFDRQMLVARSCKVADVQAERRRLEAALEIARVELQAVRDRAAGQGIAVGDADIFEAHWMLLEDPELLDRVFAAIETDSENAEYAWQLGTEYYAELLVGMSDEYLAARAADVRDVAQRVLRVLAGKRQAGSKLEFPSIVVAEELTPSDTVTFDREKVLGFCTAIGGPTSHVAILSKALGIPAVTGLGLHINQLASAHQIIVDGAAGLVILEPTQQTVSEYSRLREEQGQRYAEAFARAHQPAVTLDGKRVEVVANIGSVADAATALEFGAEGVGLLRTEFLFLDRDEAPSEDEQFTIYRSILEAFGSRPVVARTLDIGGDKPASYMPIRTELNPFLGVRGARLGLVYPEVLETQLRALLRAGAGYNLKIMFPMISTLAEVKAVRVRVQAAQFELERKGREYAQNAEIGIMVEVPSAAVLADKLAPAVDFFSIGTNDLSQYTLASDRTNPEVARLADALDPAVLRLIEMVAKAAHDQGIWVGLCGELAGDPLAAPVLLGLGIDEFSMNPRAVPYAKEALRRIDSRAAVQFANEVINLESAAQVRTYLENLRR